MKDNMVSQIATVAAALLMILALGSSSAYGQNFTLGSELLSPNCLTNCPITLRWGREGAVMNFEIILEGYSGIEWASVGFSDTASMPHADCLIAYISPMGAVQVRNANLGGYFEPDFDPDQSGIANESGMRNSTHFVSRFSRTLAPINSNDASFLPGAPTKYLMVAFGAGNIGEHARNGKHAGPILSVDLVDMRSTAPVMSIAASNANSITLAHGTMMMLGWIFLAPSATYIAHSMRFRAPLWFQLHQYMQYGAVLCTIIGYIIIKAGGEGGKSEGSPHGGLGIVVIILCIVQALMGIFRNLIAGKDKNASDPTDKGPRRWMFNYMHWGVGVLLLILGVVTVFFGIDLYGGSENKETAFFIWLGVDVAAVILAFLVNGSKKEGLRRYILAFATVYSIFNAAIVISIAAIAAMDIP
eukprot:m.86511 g.86511  ORF g.86511 m.86511 type:complete len:415 (+) comp8763_c0_seq3:161-1405(+)